VKALGLLCIVLLGSCVFPTEKDESVHVSVTPIKILFRGSDTIATARAWQMTGSDSQPIANAVFVWSSSDPAVATVDGSGRVVGINSGTTILTAAVANFDKDARPAADTIRVATPLEIDSIRPKTVHYGEILTIYGVSVDSIVSVSLKGAGLIRVPLGETSYVDGTVRSRWWVPPPAHTDSLFFLGITGGNGVLGYVRGDTTTVVEQDLYEPNDTVPQLLDLDGTPPFPSIFPTLVFANPALAFETINRGLGTDWYRLKHQGAARDLTVILSAPQVKGTYVAYLSDSLGWNQLTSKPFLGHDSWSFGPSSHFCHGAAFAPGEALGDSVIVAFKALPPGTLDVLAAYGVAGRYGLTLIAGYQSELPPDAHEDDNSCNAADLRGTIAAPFRDTLAIQNPHDVDFIRFHYVQGAIGSTAQLRLHAFGGSHPDLDLYVLQIPNPGDASVQVLAKDTTATSDVDLRPNLTTGDYYLAVVDFAGATTTYELCVGTIALLGTGPCAGAAFPAPPATVGVRRKRATITSPIVSSQPR